MSTYIVGKKEINLIQGKDGCFEGWYGKGKKTQDADGIVAWTGGIHRVITPCKTETEAVDYIDKLFANKKEPIEKLPTINFPE